MSEELKPSAGVVLPISVVPSKKLAHPLLAEAWGLGVTDTYAQAVPVSLNPTDARLGELLGRVVEHLEYDAIGSPSEAIAGDLAKELRAMLAQSE